MIGWGYCIQVLLHLLNFVNANLRIRLVRNTPTGNPTFIRSDTLLSSFSSLNHKEGNHQKYGNHCVNA